MADVFSKRKRSELMSRVRSSGNELTELALVRIFRQHGVSGWRRGFPLFGKPDFVFVRERLVVFVDGCFWHGCPRHGTTPSTNSPFWERKLARNRARDRLVNRKLGEKGWRVLRVWQHELSLKNEARVVLRIVRALQLCVTGTNRDARRARRAFDSRSGQSPLGINIAPMK